MEYLSWDLSILSRSVAYANLSAASANIGISQPQLSRIIAKLEEQLSVPLLDRESKRKSSWTPEAYRLAEIYTKTLKSFRTDVQTLTDQATPHEFRVGTLEGLVTQALKLCHGLLESTSVMVVHLDVLDISQLVEAFAKNDLDLIITAYDLGPRKYRASKTIGYQSVETVGQGVPQVLSHFEYASKPHKGSPTEKAFVSNSLSVRKTWLETYGGRGTLPGVLRSAPEQGPQELTVTVIAHDHTPAALWDKIQELVAYG